MLDLLLQFLEKNFSLCCPLATDSMIKLQAQSTSNGGFSDAYADIDHPGKTDITILIKIKIILSLVKILKVLSLSLG